MATGLMNKQAEPSSLNNNFDKPSLKDFIIKDHILVDSLIILGSKVLRRLSISLLQILVPDLVETRIEIADLVGTLIGIQIPKENPETEIQHLYLMKIIAIGAWVQIM